MEQVIQSKRAGLKQSPLFTYAVVAAAAAFWVAAYIILPPVTQWLTFDVFRLGRGSRLGESVAFFLYDVPKILLLLSGMIFLISIVRTFFSPERTRALRGGKRQGVGNVLAFMMAVVGLRLPEAIILRRVLKPQLLGIFIGVVALAIIITGYLFNLIM